MTKPSLAERFWSKVDRSGGPDACWPWTAFKLPKGYGTIGVNGVKVYAHRLAYVFANNCKIEDGMDVMHACDNPQCCNPAHLSQGTRSENIQQAYDRNRKPRPYLHGTKNPRALLGELTVQRLRIVGAALPQTRLAAILDVSPSTIFDIVHRRSWAKLGQKQALM